MMLDAATKNRFEQALASNQLKELATDMAAEGLSQVAIYEVFSAYWDLLNETKREQDEEALLASLECIVGYTSPGSKWFDHYLTNEEIDAYKKSKMDAQ